MDYEEFKELERYNRLARKLHVMLHGYPVDLLSELTLYCWNTDREYAFDVTFNIGIVGSPNLPVYEDRVIVQRVLARMYRRLMKNGS